MSEGESGAMRYGMLGEDRSGSGDKVEKYSGDVGWEYLRPHYEAGALWWVDPALSLRDVGEALASDAAAEVKRWLGVGDLVKVEALHAAQWEGGDDVFRATVVSPFVLMQEIRADGADG